MHSTFHFFNIATFIEIQVSPQMIITTSERIISRRTHVHDLWINWANAYLRNVSINYYLFIHNINCSRWDRLDSNCKNPWNCVATLFYCKENLEQMKDIDKRKKIKLKRKIKQGDNLNFCQILGSIHIGIYHQEEQGCQQAESFKSDPREEVISNTTITHNFLWVTSSPAV